MVFPFSMTPPKARYRNTYKKRIAIVVVVSAVVVVLVVVFTAKLKLIYTNHSLWPSSVADEDGMLLHFSENRLPVRKTRLVSSRHGSHIMHIKANGDFRRPTMSYLQ